GFNTVVNDNDDCILVEAGQVVINKKTLDDDKIRTYTGTNKEILNKINKHLNSGVSIYKNGGIIPIGNNKIKTIFFKKDKFTKPQAIAWAKNHGFDYANSYDENKSNYIFRCNDKNAFKKHTYRTIELKESGIKIIIGVEKMEQGGSVESIFDLDFYQVTQSSERDTDYLYQGIDFDKAKSEYNYASEQDDDTNVILEKYTNKYKFVYELDADNEETIDDYPIEDYYEDSDYYKLVENGLDSGTEILESKELHRVKSNKENIEEEFEQLQSDFIDSFENDYKNKIHLQEYAGFMGSSKYYYLLIDENGSLIDVDKENPLLLLEKKDSTFDDRIARSFQNINPENAVLCVRISDHERVYNTYGDACLSIVFDRKSDRIEIQNTDSDNENIIELVYGIEKYFDNYSIAELSDVEYSVKSVIDDFDYNNMIQNRGEFEDDEYKQGGSITQNTISENRKEFMIRESKMNNFVRTFYSDIENKYPIKIDNTHDKFEMFGAKGHFEFLIPLDKMEGEILMYFEMLTNRSMADFLNTKGNVIVTPVIKCYIDKDYNITFDYSELDKYLIQNDIEKFDKGGEIVNDKYYILSFGNYIQVKFIEKINIQGIDLFLYNDDGYFGVADEKTGIRIGGGAKEKDRAIDNANDFIEHHGEEKVIEHLKNAQLSPRYSKETKTFEESQFEKIKELYESKNFEKLYEIISNNANTTSRKALSQILERSIVNYNNSQILDLFLEFGYDVRKINLENERLKKQKEAELKQAEIDKQNEYKKTEYPYLDLSNMSAKQFGVLDKAMQKKYRYPDGVKTVSEHIKSLKDEIVETKEFIDEFTKSGDRRSEPLHEYYVKLQSGSLWSIPKLAYDNWVGFKKDTEILQGGLSDNKTILDISKKHNVSLDFANEQFEKGISVEMEHTDSRDVASEIALDHLSESINYYVELEKMEEKLNNIKLSSNYTDSQLIELCKKADINKETLVFDVPDDKVEYYKSLGFVVKN
ncbi:MAG: hypothetical protein KBG30_01520, partial [Bacteroidales bacterium]|nr:hypothetical protein [Bacteroidales bacterium]